MSITINSNMAASYSALNMKRANNNLTKSLQRLSSGKRITSPSDDAGGLAVGMKLQSALKKGSSIQTKHTKRYILFTNAGWRAQGSRRNFGSHGRA